MSIEEGPGEPSRSNWATPFESTNRRVKSRCSIQFVDHSLNYKACLSLIPGSFPFPCSCPCRSGDQDFMSKARIVIQRTLATGGTRYAVIEFVKDEYLGTYS